MSGEFVTLLGAEQVERAGHQISGAADQIQRAMSGFEESVNRLERALQQATMELGILAEAAGMAQRCQACDGSGKQKDQNWMDCHACHGKGH